MGSANLRKRRRSTFGAACLSSAALALSACRVGAEDSSVAPLPSASTNIIAGGARVHPVGELGRARDYVMSVDSVKDCPTGDPGSGKKSLAPMGVEVDILSTTDLQIPANVFYATAHDASGEHYAATLAGCEPALPAVLVANGNKAHGFITFDVPKLSRSIEIRYAPPAIGSGVEELRFSVTR